MNVSQEFDESVEKVYEHTLPENTYAVVRVDGKNFSSLTKPMRQDAPFSDEFSDRMERATQMILDHLDCAILAYTQSDEISVVIADLKERSQKPFAGRVQKIASLSAAYASVGFNAGTEDVAVFDGRVFDLGQDKQKVVDYLNHRRDSGIRNSISMAASHEFSHRSMMGVSTNDRRIALAENGTPWEDHSPRHRFGTLWSKPVRTRTVEFVRDGYLHCATVQRRSWEHHVADEGTEQFLAALNLFDEDQ